MKGQMIEVDHVSKLYKLGVIGTGTLSHDLNRWWNKTFKKETDDPRQWDQKEGYLWSLKDIHFSVNEGEVFGIIGKNGAGKSTLLKILSKITKPTRGTLRLNGRVASLLEVGTGFHPELTGRENVFLNGAILGMSKAEITKKFEAIVEFSGVKKYIDTPVKRYSSGMYVRLAFAVSAHLEPEILIVDEVLSVGDQEFQQKCLGKMKDVSSNQGRTVLFVSHQLAAIKQLCTKAILLEQGIQTAIGSVENILERYQAKPPDLFAGKRMIPDPSQPAIFTDWHLVSREDGMAHSCVGNQTCRISIGFTARELLKHCEVRLAIRLEDETLLIYTSSQANGGINFSLEPGNYRFRFEFVFPVRQGNYQMEFGLFSTGKLLDHWISGTPLTVLDDFHSPLNFAILNPATQFRVEEVMTESLL